MKLSTFTNHSTTQTPTPHFHNNAAGAYRFLVSTVYKHNSLGLAGFKLGGKNPNDIYVAGVPSIEYASTFRVLANMYYVDKSSARTARRSLKQLGWVYNSVSMKNKPQMFDTVGLSYRSIFGFARRIFLISPKFQYLRRTAAAKRTIAENRLFCTPFVQYRRIPKGLPAKQYRKK